MMGTLLDKAPNAGHNCRHFDVERTARELSSAEVWRAEFYRMHAGPKASKKQLIDAHAIIDPNVTAEEYRLLRLRLYFCNDACENYWGSTDLEAVLLNRSAAAIERASKGLECTAGKDNYQTSKRRRNQSSIRAFDTPDAGREAAKELLALCEAAKVRFQEPSEMRVDVPETANLQLRTRKNEQLTLVKNSTKEEYAQSEACAAPSGSGSPIRKPPFENYWQLYPHKVGRARAKQLWAKMPPQDCLAAIEGSSLAHISLSRPQPEVRWENLPARRSSYRCAAEFRR